MNYILTNITADGKEQTVLKDFRVPKDFDELQEIMLDYGYKVSNDEALKAYIRTMLFNFYEIEYDFQKLEIEYNHKNTAAGYYIMDMIDHKYKSYTTVNVSISFPKSFIATLSADDLYFLETDGIEQAIFENLTSSLDIEISWE